jgi:type III pantothenate kinase
MILCDIGNSFAHFFSDEQNSRIPIENFNPANYSEKIFFISVNQKISEIIESLNLQNWINLSDKVKIKTNYKTLGIDRKVAIFDAKNNIIVDAGSAITIDIIENNNHIGGYILAGKLLTEKNYQSHIPHLKFKQNSSKLNIDIIPNNTEDALFYGYLHQVILLLKNIKNNYKNLDLIITGGDGKLLVEYCENAVYIKDLIFKNMQKIVNSENLE